MNEFIVIPEAKFRQILRDEISEVLKPKGEEKIDPKHTRLYLEEAAEYCRMPVPTFRIHRARIGGAKIGKRWTFSLNELDRFIESNRRKTLREIRASV